jgi:hypothetical protein
VLGTWNILTILKPGKMQEIAEHTKYIATNSSTARNQIEGIWTHQEKDLL